jgi:hypothetical protein
LAAISSAAVAPLQAAPDNIRTSVVALLSVCRLIIQLGLIAHIILINVQRLTPDFRTVQVALLPHVRLIFLMGLIATLSVFSVLHFWLLGYRVQSLRMGCDRQCKTDPKHATSAELVKTAHQFSTAAFMLLVEAEINWQIEAGAAEGRLPGHSTPAPCVKPAA